MTITCIYIRVVKVILPFFSLTVCNTRHTLFEPVSSSTIHINFNGPLKMYVGDFDNNGKTEQLLSYTSKDIEYPFLSKDEVERPMPLLKKHYELYADYAGVSMKNVFYGWIDSTKPYTAERPESAIGDGDGKGNFTTSYLPAVQQLSPVFCFEPIGTNNAKETAYLCDGNFFDVK